MAQIMKQNKSQSQLELDNLIIGNPVSTNQEPRPATSKAKRKDKNGAAISESQQPFLPGLSRRGRPRSKNPIPATIRASQSRKRRTAAGVKRIEFLLKPETATSLDLLTEHFKITRVEMISRLIAQAAKRITAQIKLTSRR